MELYSFSKIIHVYHISYIIIQIPLNKNKMTQAALNTLNKRQLQLDTSKLDVTLPQNEELINNLTQKIDRRINNGYYYHIAAQRKTYIPQNRPKQPIRDNTKKKIHPIVKKIKKPNDPKPILIQQQQNTDEIDTKQMYQNTEKLLTKDRQQNTQGIYELKKPDPIVEDEQMQWSCEVTQIQKKNHSMQWSIEPIEQANQQIQYTLQSQLVIVECRDASIQYTLESQESIEEEPEIIKEDVEVQCQEVKKQQYSLQYNEPLPDKEEKVIQIDLPDNQQLNKISKMESHIKFLRLEQRKKERLQKKKEKQIEILKLKQVINKIEGKIYLAEQKQSALKMKRQQQMSLLLKQQQMKRQTKRIKDDASKQYNSKLQLLLGKIKQGSQRPIINNKWKEQQERRLAQLQNQQKLSKQQLQIYKKQVQELKDSLKQQMFKRLNFEDQSDDETATEQQSRTRSNSQNFRISKKVQLDNSMTNLFPNLMVKARYAGSIIRNIPNDEQKKLNDHEKSMKKSRAYWKSKSPFRYDYQESSQNRVSRKSLYLNKVLQKVNPRQIIMNPQSNGETAINNSKITKTRGDLFVQNATKQKTSRYKSRKLSYAWQQMKKIKQELETILENDQLFLYLYSEQSKINLALGLFKAYFIQIPENFHKSIVIFKYPKYIVFQHKMEATTMFIMLYHTTKTIISGRIQQKRTNYQYYTNYQTFKDGEICEYLTLSQLFCGFYKAGQRQGYGIFSNSIIHYEGQFMGGKKDGFGKLILQNGDIYRGSFKNNCFQGEGIYNWISGEMYDGFFSQGLKNGYGKHIFCNGDIYQGSYKFNKRQGKGLYQWKQGTIYEGQFSNDQKNGQGKLTYQNGGSLLGIWKNDQIIEIITRQKMRQKSREELPLKSKLRTTKNH